MVFASSIVIEVFTALSQLIANPRSTITDCVLVSLKVYLWYAVLCVDVNSTLILGSSRKTW